MNAGNSFKSLWSKVSKTAFNSFSKSYNQSKYYFCLMFPPVQKPLPSSYDHVDFHILHHNLTNDVLLQKCLCFNFVHIYIPLKILTIYYCSFSASKIKSHNSRTAPFPPFLFALKLQIF